MSMQPLAGLAPPLTPAQYAHCFRAYQSISGERHAMLCWVRDVLRKAWPGRRHLTVLSVGCGTGTFDQRVLQVLSSDRRTLNYIGLEPNEKHRRTFLTRITRRPLPGINLALQATPFEHYTSRRRFDLVLLTHCLYYIPDRDRAIRKAMDFLRTDGRVIICHQTPLGIDQIQRRFLKRVKGRDNEMFSSRDLQALLDRRGLAYCLEILDNTLDISSCFIPHDKTGQELLSFFLESDTRCLPPAVRREILVFLKTLSIRREKRRLLIHPMAMFSIVRRQPA